VADDPQAWQLDIAVSPFDTYAPTARTTLDLIRDAARYLSVLQSRLQELEAGAPGFDLCLYNAGMDPFEGCSIGGLRGITRAILEYGSGLSSTGVGGAGSPLHSCSPAATWAPVLTSRVWSPSIG
jgi:hypothetical protein